MQNGERIKRLIQNNLIWYGGYQSRGLSVYTLALFGS
jgi:hypothetical protein